jgi:hypothetical protein
MNVCRILNRLEEAERSEPDSWLRHDIRQAFITISLAQKGSPMPFIEASYAVFGKHPDRVWPHIMANRKAKLGKEFGDWFDQAGNLKPDIQKKTSAPVTTHPDEQVPANLAAVLMFPKREAA